MIIERDDKTEVAARESNPAPVSDVEVRQIVDDLLPQVEPALEYLKDR